MKIKKKIEVLTYTQALLYCRVSTVGQVTDGSGLESQEQRCREYARNKGYSVERVFVDSYTGGGDFMNRPGMRALLEYVDKNPHTNYVVIFDDLKRFARDTEFHFKLRSAFKARDIRPECLNYNFDDSPEGVFVETIFAAQGKLEKDQNRRQVIQKMTSRLKAGYWPFYAPPGYIQKRDPIHGKILIQDNPKAKIITEALEGFASGRFQEQMDVCKFLVSKNYFAKSSYYNRLTIIKRMLTRSLYAGYIEYPDWKVARRIGHHKSLIPKEIFEKIQNKLKGKISMRYRKDVNVDFPLRGFILCSECERELTSSWCSGRHNKKYPYYRCVWPQCPMKNKSIQRHLPENQLLDILQKSKPKQELLDYIKSRLVIKWEGAERNIKETEKSVSMTVANIKSRIQNLVSMIDSNKSGAVNEAYERQIEELSQQEMLEASRLSKISSGKINFETALELVMSVVDNPYERWQKGDLTHRRLLLNMVFNKKVAYSKNHGFETANLQLPIKVFEQNNRSNVYDVEMATLKPRAQDRLK